MNAILAAHPAEKARSVNVAQGDEAVRGAAGSLGLYAVFGGFWAVFQHVGIWQTPLTLGASIGLIEPLVTWPLGVAQLVWLIAGGEL